MTADLHESIIHLCCATALLPPKPLGGVNGGVPAFQEAVFIHCRGRARENSQLI